MIDPRTDVFGDQSSFTYNCPPLTGRFKLSHKRPLMYGFTSGAPVDDTGPGSARDHGRIALRTRPGRHGLLRRRRCPASSRSP